MRCSLIHNCKGVYKHLMRNKYQSSGHNKVISGALLLNNHTTQTPVVCWLIKKISSSWVLNQNLRNIRRNWITSWFILFFNKSSGHNTLCRPHRRSNGLSHKRLERLPCYLSFATSGVGGICISVNKVSFEVKMIRSCLKIKF